MIFHPLAGIKAGRTYDPVPLSKGMPAKTRFNIREKVLACKWDLRDSAVTIDPIKAKPYYFGDLSDDYLCMLSINSHALTLTTAVELRKDTINTQFFHIRHGSYLKIWSTRKKASFAGIVKSCCL